MTEVSILKEFKEKYDYNPETGVITRAYTYKNFKVGDVAGSLQKDGSMMIRIGKTKYPAQRLVWLLTYGEFPQFMLKHKDGNKSNNRLDNIEMMDKFAERQLHKRVMKNVELDLNGYDGEYVTTVCAVNRAKFEELGMKLPIGNYEISVNKEALIYIGSLIKVDVECECGVLGSTRAYRAKGWKCRSCAKIDESLSDEDRQDRRKIPYYQKWSYDVKVKDNFTCQVCGDNKGGNLVSHHLESYNLNKEKRLDIDNGVCLCDTCHKDFHKKFGYGNNTSEQFEQYIYEREVE